MPLNRDPFTWPALALPEGHGTPEKPMTLLECIKQAAALTAVVLSLGYFAPTPR